MGGAPGKNSDQELTGCHDLQLAIFFVHRHRVDAILIRSEESRSQTEASEIAVIADQVRSQGFACTNSSSAKRGKDLDGTTLKGIG
jgi:hypothetical protein